ncbi:MAG: MBL fold metallo-hydrolase [Gammaproteobacteria bacterium]|nr:MBL fold metallo-hydrolase [Gammaproteobacteria bacterium]
MAGLLAAMPASVVAESPAAQAAAVVAPIPRAQWVTLGTVGGPPLHAGQAPIANALVVGDALYLFDVGNGVLRQLDGAGLAVRNLHGVFLTHHHVDHNADLGLVILQAWTFAAHQPVPVLGPPGTVHLVSGLVGANAPTVLAGFAVNGAPNPPLASAVAARELAAELAEPTVVFEDGTLRVSAISVEHFQIPPVGHLDALPRAVAYRVEAGGRSFVYSGDTGPTGQLAKLARGADVLFTEVVDIPSIEVSLRQLMAQAPPGRVAAMARNMSRNHLEPEVIGQIATDAGVKRVVLTHYVPGFKAMRNPAELVRRVGSRYPGPVSLAHDLERF